MACAFLRDREDKISNLLNIFFSICISASHFNDSNRVKHVLINTAFNFSLAWILDNCFHLFPLPHGITSLQRDWMPPHRHCWGSDMRRGVVVNFVFL